MIIAFNVLALTLGLSSAWAFGAQAVECHWEADGDYKTGYTATSRAGSRVIQTTEMASNRDYAAGNRIWL